MTAKLIPPQAPVKWDHTPELIASLTKDLIKEAKELDDKIGKLSINESDLESVIYPYAELENKQSGLSNQLTFYQYVSSDKSLREASNKSDIELNKFFIESGLRDDVFIKINKVFNDTKNNNSLDPQLKRFVEKLNNQYKRNGLSLPLETRDKIKIIKEELSKLSIKFSTNLNEQNEYLLFTKDELTGLPNDVIEGFEKTNDNKYKMTFKYPDLFPVLKYAKNEETRKKAFTADQNKCPENSEILIKAVKLRSELANLLGYKNYSEYVLEERMAKNPETVMKFLEDLKIKLKPLGQNEFNYLKSLKENETNTENVNYYIWDQRYYHTKMLENDYNVDEIKISEYFPMNNTINKMLSIYENLFNLKFNEISKNDKLYNTWHEDVKQFSVWELDNINKPKFIGYIYFDLHPREGKYGHAANFGLFPSYVNPINSNNRYYPTTSLVCNFTKDLNDKPSLLKHNEVVTFFHELGHGIHSLLGQTKFSRFHGTRVSKDFVEMPSQLLEYFCWDKKILKKLSNHYKTNESMPDNLIDSLIKSKNVNGAMFNLRQLHFGLFDMLLHTSNDGNIDIDNLWNKMREDICILSNGNLNFKGYGSFGHLMGGYASGYYGYLWSHVYASDIYFTKFNKDPMNKLNGLEYRDKVLIKGGSNDEMNYLIDLLNREPSSNSFLDELGLNNI